MKKIILSENGIKTIENKVIEESYSDKVSIVKKFLDDNFMRATYEKVGDDGTIREIGVFVQLNGKKLPTKSSLELSSVFDIVQDKFKKIFGDKSSRDGFLLQTIKDWYDNKITKNGSLSSYEF